MAAEGAVRTRQAAGLMNVVKPRSWLEVKNNFFSVRVADGWNLVPEEIKMARTDGHFKRLYKLTGAAYRGKREAGRRRDWDRQRRTSADGLRNGPRWPDGDIPTSNPSK